MWNMRKVVVLYQVYHKHSKFHGGRFARMEVRKEAERRKLAFVLLAPET